MLECGFFVDSGLASALRLCDAWYRLGAVVEKAREVLGRVALRAD